MSIAEFHVVEWSPSQKAFHRQTLVEMLENNISVFIRRVPADYIPIGIFETEAEVSKFLEKAYRCVDQNG